MALLLNACTARYYDPVPPDDARPEVIHFDSPLGMEDSYRRLYARLSDCVPVVYLVQPRLYHDPPQATIMVVQGLGLNHYSAFGNTFKARFDVYPQDPGSRIEITNIDESMVAVIAASRDWLQRDTRGCRASE